MVSTKLEDIKNKCLLIWPPFVSVSKLPLGIPSLTTYLKKSGINGVEVIDLNMAYLQQMRLFFFLYKLNRRYNNFADKASHKLKNGRRDTVVRMKKNRSSARKAISHVFRSTNKMLNKLLDYIVIRKRQSIPLSLESIVEFDFKNIYEIDKKKIQYFIGRLIKKNNFFLVGISVMYPEQLFFAFLTAKILKEINKNIYIVFGGAQITKCINHIVNNKKVYNLVDFFIINDGEEPLAKLLNKLTNKHFDDIPNLYFRTSSGTKGYEKPRNWFSLHPDDFFVPDFTGFNLDIYGNQMPIITSKGCFWFKCNFCTYASMHKHRYSITKIDTTIQIIKGMIKKYRTTRYRFVDDELSPRFMRELAEALSKEKLNIKWASNIILSREFADKNFCNILAKSGLFQVTIGLESISSRILNLMNKYHKDISELETKKILINLKDSGIKVPLYIMFGFPTETLYEARRTLNFLIENKDLYDICIFQPFSLEDNTPIFNKPEDFGIVKIYDRDEKFGERFGYRYDVTEGMSQEEAEKFTYGEAFNALEKAGVRVRSTKVRSY